MLRKVTVLMLALSALAASSAIAEEMDHKAGGLGFHLLGAPVGGRWWFASNKVAVDLGFGFTSEKLAGIGTDPVTGEPTDETFNSITVDFGVPFCVATWEQVHVLVRPGFNWSTEDDIDYFFDTDELQKRTSYSATIEGEVELFVAKNASISAAYGAGFESTKLDIDGAEADTFFGTFGNNFTTLGLHVYLW